MSSSNSPCARCKILRQKCTQECVFAPYFPPDQQQKFARVHQVYGASNVAKLLNDLNPNQREDAVYSLAYEAEERIRDPINGCVSLIVLLQHNIKQLQGDICAAKMELAHYIGPNAMLPILQQPSYLFPTDAHQSAGFQTVRDQSYTYRSYDQHQSQLHGQQQQQQDLFRYNPGTDSSGALALLRFDENHIGPSFGQ